MRILLPLLDYTFHQSMYGSKKISFLAKLQESERDDLSSCVFQTLSPDNVYSISVVDQCRWLLEELTLGGCSRKIL